jgi:tRNA U38,U39,U40 pseudouridine synthase TruA
MRSAIPREVPDELVNSVLRHPSDSLLWALNGTAAAGAGAGAGAGEEEAAEGAAAGGSKKAKREARSNATAASSSASTSSTASSTTSSCAPRVLQEMDYCGMLNRSLPEAIRVVGWAPVTDEFNARFSASYRQYRYFFLRKHLNLAAMRAAAARLVGTHDFRNLSKLDIANVSNFKREIFSAEIKLYSAAAAEQVSREEQGWKKGSAAGTVLGRDGGGGAAEEEEEEEEEVVPVDSDDPEAVYMLEIKGIAFLWHMVRCIMAVLLLVGEGREQPQVVSQLLDVEECRGKPPYPLADEAPLVLHDCGFDRLQLHLPPRNLWQLTAHYRQVLEGHIVAAARARNSLEFVLSRTVREQDVSPFLQDILPSPSPASLPVSVAAATIKGGGQASEMEIPSTEPCTAKSAVRAILSKVLQGPRGTGLAGNDSSTCGAPSESGVSVKRKIDAIEEEGHGVIAHSSSSSSSNRSSCSDPNAGGEGELAGVSLQPPIYWRAVLRAVEANSSVTPQVRTVAKFVPLMQVDFTV